MIKIFYAYRDMSTYFLDNLFHAFLQKANHAVHLRAAVCEVWCNRVVRRRGFMRPLHTPGSGAAKGGGHETLGNSNQFSPPPFGVPCNRGVRLRGCMRPLHHAVHLRAAFCDVWCNRIVRHPHIFAYALSSRSQFVYRKIG